MKPRYRVAFRFKHLNLPQGCSVTVCLWFGHSGFKGDDNVWYPLAGTVGGYAQRVWWPN